MLPAVSLILGYTYCRLRMPMHGRSTYASPLLHNTLTTLVPRFGASISARISVDLLCPALVHS